MKFYGMNRAIAQRLQAARLLTLLLSDSGDYAEDIQALLRKNQHTMKNEITGCLQPESQDSFLTRLTKAAKLQR